MMQAAAMQTNTEPPGCCSTRPATRPPPGSAQRNLKIVQQTL